MSVQIPQAALDNAVVAQDENGRPFIIVRDQGNKKRLKGIDAVKSHILAAKTLSHIVRTSLGPRGWFWGVKANQLKLMHHRPG